MQNRKELGGSRKFPLIRHPEMTFFDWFGEDLPWPSGAALDGAVGQNRYLALGGIRGSRRNGQGREER